LSVQTTCLLSSEIFGDRSPGRLTGINQGYFLPISTSQVTIRMTEARDFILVSTFRLRLAPR